jgi:ammonia channel protein AmtB
LLNEFVLGLYAIHGSIYFTDLCLFCHMTWHPDGLFFKMGVLDFAGGTVVHECWLGGMLEQCF